MNTVKLSSGALLGIVANHRAFTPQERGQAAGELAARIIKLEQKEKELV